VGYYGSQQRAKYVMKGYVMDKRTVLGLLARHIDEIRRRFSVKALYVFGSVARGEAGDNSDIDVAVTFEGTAAFDAFMDLKFYLEELLGHPVDLVTNKAIRPEMRGSVEREMINVA
jgi:predicted nucleotidyltransferase